MALQAITKDQTPVQQRLCADSTRVCLRRASITGSANLQRYIEPPGTVIELDMDEQYERMIKDVYGANIEFLSRAQALAARVCRRLHGALRHANTGVVKPPSRRSKRLRKNLLHCCGATVMLSPRYNPFGCGCGSPALSGGAGTPEDSVVALLSWAVRVEILGSESKAARWQTPISATTPSPRKMATSLINDSGYVREVIQRLLDMNEQLHRARLPYGEAVQG